MNKSEKKKLLYDAGASAVETKQKLLADHLDNIINLSNQMTRVLKKGGTIYLAGNGGSAADCQHFATEMVVRLSARFKRPSMPAVSLTADSSLLTAAGNDFGFENIFARQCQSLVRKKDALFLISTSGNSENLIQAARTAKSKGSTILGLIGFTGGKIKKYCTASVVVPSQSVQRIQEEHIFIIHNLVALVERDLFA